ncbi:MAG: hypothetical protein KGI00_02870 [Candidatus Micrarchaeota archaeon]|nr:hypothetical protein [Candidatus Micrarchaeota archaeon]
MERGIDMTVCSRCGHDDGVAFAVYSTGIIRCDKCGEPLKNVGSNGARVVVGEKAIISSNNVRMEIGGNFQNKGITMENNNADLLHFVRPHTSFNGLTPSEMAEDKHRKRKE